MNRFRMTRRQSLLETLFSALRIVAIRSASCAPAELGRRILNRTVGPFDAMPCRPHPRLTFTLRAGFVKLAGGSLQSWSLPRIQAGARRDDAVEHLGVEHLTGLNKAGVLRACCETLSPQRVNWDC